jgi:hypothetical protein
VINKALPARREAVETRPGDNLRRKVAVARLCRSGNEGLHPRGKMDRRLPNCKGIFQAVGHGSCKRQQNLMRV